MVPSNLAVLHSLKPYLNSSKCLYTHTHTYIHMHSYTYTHVFLKVLKVIEFISKVSASQVYSLINFCSVNTYALSVFKLRNSMTSTLETHFMLLSKAPPTMINTTLTSSSIL